jgi:hypothetical protein
MARGTPSPRAAVSRQTLDFERSLGLNHYFLGRLPVPVAWFPGRDT